MPLGHKQSRSQIRYNLGMPRTKAKESNALWEKKQKEF